MPSKSCLPSASLSLVTEASSDLASPATLTAGSVGASIFSAGKLGQRVGQARQVAHRRGVDGGLGHADHQPGLDLDRADVLLRVDLVAARELDRRQDAELREQLLDVLLLEHGQRLGAGGEVEQAALLHRHLVPLGRVAVAAEHDCAVLIHDRP